MNFYNFSTCTITLSVFKQEINTDSDIKRDNLISKLNIKKMEISMNQCSISLIKTILYRRKKSDREKNI